MESKHIGGHYLQSYDTELEEVFNHMLAMGELVEAQLRNALSAFITSDLACARDVADNDRRVNTAEVLIDERCTEILARRQPTAGDLRLVVAVIKTITDLERIGDLAESIARMVIRNADSERPRRQLLRELETMGQRVANMLHEALDAFARSDVDKALEIVRQDVDIDNDYEALTRQNMTYMMEDPRSISFMLDISQVARALERAGDHACNLSEYLIYLVKGRDVRHIDIDQVAAIVHDQRDE
ncbi:phosphate transport system regulatory protein PhoU [Thiocapsa imhoffii]|uniref:Phosphate-specific transport system accessory protein PhoU n=1 Tax=Thiocapsa imhoffii TaxID=382777 RepID=A0A9X0WL72_9GAMM|nr:phosphate signaling complex protein PhoU [Thiocapsa imhoffii]MBK1646767.1 phosphate transport system regulatory protein PhoU [Thiocapsa imhoffii]